MIQDIFPHRFNNSYQPNRKITDNDYVLHFEGNTMFTRDNLPEHALNISIAGEMIEKFGKGEL